MRTKYEDIDQYILSFPVETQKSLEQLRDTIHKAAPEARETISYGIPTFTLHGNLVHFAAYNKHIGFYPTSSGIEAFRQELSEFEISKGTVRFPIGKKLPLGLVSNIVKFRVAENLTREGMKKH